MHVALVGASGFGRHHLRAMQQSPYVEAVTLVGRNRDRLLALQAEHDRVRRVCTDLEEVLSDPEVALVDIVLPHHLHLPVALQAFAAGKDVIVEKPPARTPAEFQQMRDAAAASGRRLFVVLNLLFNPFHRVVRQVLDAGRIGQPFLSLEVSLPSALATYQDPGYWRADREQCGGGNLIDGGFHSVYRQLYFLESLGAPRWLTADCGQIGVREPSKGEDFAALTLAYEGGARVHLLSQWTARAGLGRFPSGILGTEGTLLFTGDPAQPLLLRRPGAEDEPVPVPEGPSGFDGTVTACVEHYLECAATGREPYASPELAALTLEIITGAYTAEGRRVPLHGTFRTTFPPGQATC
jgi:predicted dehydrogenase